jgi:type III restriction enzyme
MAKRGQSASLGGPAEDQAPIQAVPDPILCSPYHEPAAHWVYTDGVPKAQSGRRAAGYFYKVERTGASQEELFREENRDDLPLVNKLREDVSRWREAGYRGATEVTKELLRFWSRSDRRRRLFFCQLEAVETVIYLLEMRIPGRSRATGFQNFALSDDDLELLLKGEKPKFDLTKAGFFPTLLDQPADPSFMGLRRLGCKMATGSGKTVVMAMIVAWAFCNRGRNPQSTHFPNAVLICAPNLTVKSRLQVLRPDSPDNYYTQFEIVPSHFNEYLRAGKVMVTNWHVFKPNESGKEGDQHYRVVKKGEEDELAFTLNRLGDLASRLPLLVLNDEGHHCWRPKLSEEEAAKEAQVKGEFKDELSAEIEEARVWLSGLDRINNCGKLGPGKPCILATVDLSATPFYIGGSGQMEGSPFPWLVSDFGLVDAIESGITKIPRLPVMQEGGSQKPDDAGRPDPKYFRLWEHMKAQFKPKDKQGAGYKPEAIYREAEDALLTIAAQWKQRYDQYVNAEINQQILPPAMIVVCPDTATSKYFFEKISGQREEEVPKEDGKGTEQRMVYEEGAVLQEFTNSPERPCHTVRIDTAFERALRGDAEESKDERIAQLRRIVDTVGKVGQPGEHVRCLVSVAKLTEGWDANNVTQVLGMRAFGSQLLCEQVVGRGLRRRSYTTYKPGSKPGHELLEPEYVDVYGIPFSLIPFKGRAVDEQAPEDKPQNHVSVVSARSAMEIRAPRVEGYVYGVRADAIACDVSKLERFTVEEVPNAVYVNVVRGYNDDPSAGPQEDYLRQDREAFYATVHTQAIHFRIARMVVDRLIDGAVDDESPDRVTLRLQAKHMLFPQVFRIIQKYIETRVQFGPGVNPKEIGLERYVQRIVDQVTNGITPAAASAEAPLLPVLNRMNKYHSTRDSEDTSTLPVVAVEKSHLSGVVCRSSLEREAAELLDALPVVECFAANSGRFGLRISYDYGAEKDKYYEPDFLVRVRGGATVVLEIKGMGGEFRDPNMVNAKNQAATKWVAAVNNARRYGVWGYEICRDLGELEQLLERHATPLVYALPFRKVEPRDDEKFKTCVPLVPLRIAAGAFSDSQEADGGPLWDSREWVEISSSAKLAEGMFVAQIRGNSMEPRIADGAYCLFRPPSAGSRQGRLLVVQHHRIDDPAYGGRFTFKRYKSAKVVDPETGEWMHALITLEPLNPECSPIEIAANEEDEFRVIAEFVEVL